MTWTPAPAGYPSVRRLPHRRGREARRARSSAGSRWAGSRRTCARRRSRSTASPRPSRRSTTAPASTGASIFDAVGWDVTVDESDANVAEPSGESWSDAEMHADDARAPRLAPTSTREWRYHLLCVRRLDSTERGIMYDAYGGDSNNIPREGAGISSHWMIPNADPWGAGQGHALRHRAGAVLPHRRARDRARDGAVPQHRRQRLHAHDAGHRRRRASPPVQFPDNIQWSYAPDDQKRLRHMPDIWVRPGGDPVRRRLRRPRRSARPTPSRRPEGWSSTVTPLLDAGADRRARARRLHARERRPTQPLPIPASLSMKGGAVRGRVVDPSGRRADVLAARALHRGGRDPATLEPGESVGGLADAAARRRGRAVPGAGRLRVVVEVEWALGEVAIRARRRGAA